jgi:trehalose-phosphatase
MNTTVQKYLFGNNVRLLDKIFDELKSERRIILFLDYDGTLAPIRENPRLAILTKHMHKLMCDLNAHDNISIYIVTGRSHSGIKNVFKIKDITLISNHGFQINEQNKNWFHPEINHFIPLLKKIRLLLINELNSLPSVFVEDKKLTLTVHYRNVENKIIPLVKKKVRDVIAGYSDELHNTFGKKVVEIRPNVKWNKGEAVLMILKNLRLRKETTSILYIGDDKTDEDAFKALKNKAITIVVGRKQKSHADYYVRNIDEVQNVLERIRSLFQE